MDDYDNKDDKKVGSSNMECQMLGLDSRGLLNPEYWEKCEGGSTHAG
jgi:hypothetical protein